MDALRHVREWITMGLIALLPFHAFAVTVLSRIIQGPDMRPIRELAMWKEGVLAIILGVAGVEILLKIVKSICHSKSDRAGRLKGGISNILTLDLLDACILGLMAIAAILTATQTPINKEAVMFGIRYDFLPLIAFLVFRRVLWSDWFKTIIIKVLLAIGVIIAGYGILTFFLPQKFFVWLGYTDLVSLYLPWKPIAAYQEISGLGLRRIQSTLSGPNQLGIWLLIPWSVWLVVFLDHLKVVSYKLLAVSFKHIITGIFLAIALGLTFSRSAWIATAVITVIALWNHLPRLQFKMLATYILPLTTVCLLVTICIFPQILTRITSSRDHLLRPLAAIQKITERPLGHGLGTAGPASNRISDPCMYLEAGSDYSWAHDRPELCIFVGGKQVTNPDTGCNCPFLPENWYLQIGVELGVLGMLLFLLLIFFTLRKLTTYNLQPATSRTNLSQLTTLGLIGISIACLFLHAWEDTATAFTVWILCATLLSTTKKKLPPTHS